MLKNDELDLLTRMLYWLADGTPLKEGDADALKALLEKQKEKKRLNSRKTAKWCKNNREKHNRWNREGYNRRKERTTE